MVTGPSSPSCWAEMSRREQAWDRDTRLTLLVASQSGRGGGQVRETHPDTHLPRGAGQAAELVGSVDGHHGHGGRSDGPAQRVGPLGEDVGSVVRGPEGCDADHDHELEPRDGGQGRPGAGLPSGWLQGRVPRATGLGREPGQRASVCTLQTGAAAGRGRGARGAHIPPVLRSDGRGFSHCPL